jgi:hypothetical protein
VGGWSLAIAVIFLGAGSAAFWGVIGSRCWVVIWVVPSSHHLSINTGAVLFFAVLGAAPGDCDLCVRWRVPGAGSLLILEGLLGWVPVAEGMVVFPTTRE